MRRRDAVRELGYCYMFDSNLTEKDITRLASLRKEYEAVKRLLDGERGEQEHPLAYADPDALKAARELVGMSQRDMANALSVSQAGYSSKENSPRRFTKGELEEMIKALDKAGADERRSSAAVALVLGQVTVDTKYYHMILEERIREEATEGLSLLSGEDLLTVQSVIISMIESKLLYLTLEYSDYKENIEALKKEIGGNLITDEQRREEDKLEAVLKEVFNDGEPLERYLDSVQSPQDLRHFINDERRVEEVSNGFSTISSLYES